MPNILRSRIQQKHRTIGYPDQPPVLPPRFRGRPRFLCEKPAGDEKALALKCPYGAVILNDGKLPALDLGRCLFCADCPCAAGWFEFTSEFRLAARRRYDLLVAADKPLPPLEPLETERRNLFSRSFKLREVSAGGCNACEADTSVLTTIVFDLGRFGIQFVASPRHADAVLVTGPVTHNMRLALEKTHAAIPAPRLVIASGACAIGGGPCHGLSASCNGVDTLLSVDLYIPGCPPHPLTILHALLGLLGRLPEERHETPAG